MVEETGSAAEQATTSLMVGPMVKLINGAMSAKMKLYSTARHVTTRLRLTRGMTPTCKQLWRINFLPQRLILATLLGHLPIQSR